MDRAALLENRWANMADHANTHLHQLALDMTLEEARHYLADTKMISAHRGVACLVIVCERQGHLISEQEAAGIPSGQIWRILQRAGIRVKN